jgi:hypothetical protein
VLNYFARESRTRCKPQATFPNDLQNEGTTTRRKLKTAWLFTLRTTSDGSGQQDRGRSVDDFASWPFALVCRCWLGYRIFRLSWTKCFLFGFEAKQKGWDLLFLKRKGRCCQHRCDPLFRNSDVYSCSDGRCSILFLSSQINPSTLSQGLLRSSSIRSAVF